MVDVSSSQPSNNNNAGPSAPGADSPSPSAGMDVGNGNGNGNAGGGSAGAGASASASGSGTGSGTEQQAKKNNLVVLEYLRQRGFKSAEKAFQEELQASVTGKKGAGAITDLVLIPSDLGSDSDGGGDRDDMDADGDGSGSGSVGGGDAMDTTGDGEERQGQGQGRRASKRIAASVSAKQQKKGASGGAAGKNNSTISTAALVAKNAPSAKAGTTATATTSAPTATPAGTTTVPAAALSTTLPPNAMAPSVASTRTTTPAPASVPAPTAGAASSTGNALQDGVQASQILAALLMGNPGLLTTISNNASGSASGSASTLTGTGTGFGGVTALSAPSAPPPTIADLLAGLEGTGAEDALALDPTDKHEGFRQLEEWVDGSLDMYRPEFRPILFPVFCHFYLELIQQGFKDAAADFFAKYSGAIPPTHSSTTHHLSTLLLPTHAQSSPIATRLRSEKYTVRMSRSGFGLLLGWLTDGVGGERMGGGDAIFVGERGRRGRAAVMRVVNDRLRFDITTAPTTAVQETAWEESAGLIDSLVPPINGASTTSKNYKPDPRAFNASTGELKLGPAPLSAGLREETDRALSADSLSLTDDPMAGPNGSTSHQGGDRDGDVRMNGPSSVGSADPAQISPTFADLPPYPTAFRTMDIRREVERTRDMRKRIRLDPSVLHGSPETGVNGFGVGDKHAAAARSKYLANALPSICAYTFHDAHNMIACSTFSPDSSLLAAGFSESYIRLWSLKGEKLRGYRSDFNPSSVRDLSGLKKLREKGGSTTRKLIGHSAPVYSLSFDPVHGTAAPPRYLLSSSADATTRLWSLDTMTNVVAYRGHQNPVWDVEWSPMGIYFATGSRDRTARLWSTERANALRVFAGHLSDVDCVKFHPNSLYLATGSSDRSCRLWDVQRGSCMRVFIGHQGAISALAMSPDGRYLASAATDLAINLWDLASGRRIKKMTGHTAPINSISFSACSSLLVSGSSDWTVRCWDVKGAGGAKDKRGGGRGDDGDVAGGLGMAGRMGVDGDLLGDDGSSATSDLLATFPTKRTPVMDVQFTPRNLCLISGVYTPPSPIS
ncbi:hypothetical protein BOTBODRAFT_183267 [Botryobasidium botryosum FD-172 SS1]|uniref:TFIID subunit TAF5 NTD2 domain-containing protein n=1 Tax=Botryobasidium botryosum (strain FD-172 SS1) TaxID=930990 RepID=A0A067N8N0_BOTB1|nr:hypothetical protein BOTBODRAFT_183267 [Botryobasidium botryosum FD-172 SS1]